MIKNGLILSFMSRANHTVPLPVVMCAVVLTLRLFLYCSLFLCVRILFRDAVHTRGPKKHQHNTYYIHGINFISRMYQEPPPRTLRFSQKACPSLYHPLIRLCFYEIVRRNIHLASFLTHSVT